MVWSTYRYYMLHDIWMPEGVGQSNDGTLRMPSHYVRLLIVRKFANPRFKMID